MDMLKTIIRRTKIPSKCFKQMFKRNNVIFSDTDYHLISAWILYRASIKKPPQTKTNKNQPNTHNLWNSSCFLNENICTKIKVGFWL